MHLRDRLPPARRTLGFLRIAKALTAEGAGPGEGWNRDPDQEPRKPPPRRTQRAQRKASPGQVRTETQTRNLESHRRRERRGRRGRGAWDGLEPKRDRGRQETPPRRTQRAQGKQDLGRVRTEIQTRNLESHHRRERRGRRGRRAREWVRTETRLRTPRDVTAENAEDAEYGDPEMGQNRDPDQEPRKTSPQRTQRAQRKARPGMG